MPDQSQMKSKTLKILISVIFVIAFVIIYLRSGETYYKNVGFGGPSLKLRLGTFSYQHWSDVGELDRTIGFVNPFKDKIELNLFPKLLLGKTKRKLQLQIMNLNN